jgi:uncharacterized integral membrane protein
VGLLPRRLDPDELKEWQPRLWLTLVGLLLLAAYVIAFVLENRKQVALHFVFFTAHVSLIWLILLSLGLGCIGGLLLSQLSRRRARGSSGGPSQAARERAGDLGQARDAGVDVGRPDSAEREAR